MSWNASLPPSLPVSSSGIYGKSYKGPAPPIDLDTLPQTFEQLDEAIASYTATDRTPRLRRWELNELSLAVRDHTKRNILNAWNESMGSPDYTFTSFPNLPTEIRLRIWDYALSTPRIVELVKVRHTSSLAMQFQYKHKPVPPLLHTNSESRTISQKVYRSFTSPAESSELDCGNWIRFGYDIIHLRDFDFSEDVAGYAIEGVGRAVAGSAEWRGIGRFGDRWVGRPSMFEHIRTLCVSRATLTQSIDDYECVLRHFFPKLSTLVVLIDIGINFADIIPEDADSEEIEDERPNHSRWFNYEKGKCYEEARSLFSRTCTGPIRFATPTPCSNYGHVSYSDYGRDISLSIQDHLCFEEQRCDSYNAPIVLLGDTRLPSRIDQVAPIPQPPRIAELECESSFHGAESFPTSRKL
jgi:hypothetical protein